MRPDYQKLTMIKNRLKVSFMRQVLDSKLSIFVDCIYQQLTGLSILMSASETLMKFIV